MQIARERLTELKLSHQYQTRAVGERIIVLGMATVERLTHYIVDETVTLARARSGSHVALRVLDLIEQSAGIRIERIDRARFDASMTMSFRALCTSLRTVSRAARW